MFLMSDKIKNYPYADLQGTTHKLCNSADDNETTYKSYSRLFII